MLCAAHQTRRTSFPWRWSRPPAKITRESSTEEVSGKATTIGGMHGRVLAANCFDGWRSQGAGHGRRRSRSWRRAGALAGAVGRARGRVCAGAVAGMRTPGVFPGSLT